MPFTFSHPAIILPLSYLPKGWVSMTGLVIGSLVPDFEYFFRMRLLSMYSHTLEGLFWFDLPLGLLLALTFHTIVRNPLIEESPAFLRSRFISFKSLRWNSYFMENWLIVCFSVLIGAASHILWDSFTHHGGFFVEAIPLLSNQISVLDFHLPVLKLLQHGSTLLGGVVVLLFIWKLPKENVPAKKGSLAFWVISGFISLAIVGLRMLTKEEIAPGNLIVSIITAILVGITLGSLWYGKYQRGQFFA